MAKDAHNITNENAFVNIGKVFCLISLGIGLLNIIIRVLILKFHLFHGEVTGTIWGHLFTIISLLLTGIGIWLLRNDKPAQWEIWTSRVLAVVMLIFILSITITPVFEYDFFSDTFLTSDSKVNRDRLIRNLPIVTIYGSLLSLSILFLDLKSKKLYRTSEFLCYILILLSILNIYSYIFEISIINPKKVQLIPFSLWGSLMVLFQASAIIFIRPAKGSMRILIGTNPVRVILIRFFALLAPLIFGYLATIGENAKLYSQEFGKGLLTTFSFALTMSLLWVKAQIQHNTKKHKRKLHIKIKNERERLHKLLKLSPTLINIVDVEKDKLLFTNIDEEHFFIKKGLKKKNENLGWHEKLLKVTHPDDQKQEKESWAKVKKLKSGEYEENIYRVGEKENYIWYMSRRYVYKMKDDKVVQVLTNAIDITKEQERIRKIKLQKNELAKAEEKLKKNEKELEIANESLEEKVAKNRDELIENNKRYKDFIENNVEAFAHFDFTELSLNYEKDRLAELILEKSEMVEINDPMIQLLGYDNREEFDNKQWSNSWVDSEDKKEEIMREFINQDFKIEHFEIILRKKNKEEFTAKASLIGLIENNRLQVAMIIVEEK